MVAPSKRLALIPPYLFAEISRIKREAIASGADVIDLGIGDPDIPTPTPVIEALAEAAREPSTHRYDESARGWKPFLEAAANWHQRTFGTHVNPDTEVAQLIGSKEGLAHLAYAYLDPGDVAICPSPGYPVYRVNSLMAGGEAFSLPLSEEQGWLPRLEDIPSDVARRAKLFYVCYPHNPTGAVAPLTLYKELVAYCREYQILLASDMAYAAVSYDGYQPPSVLQVEGAKDVAIEFHSLSKTFNMTGWRLGFSVGNPEAVQTLQRLKDNIDSKQFPAIAQAGAHALRHVDNAETLAIYRRRRDILCQGLAALGWKVPEPKASFYVWARVPAPNLTSAEFARLVLEKAHIVMIPGTGYGPEGEGYVRISLTLPGDRNGERFAEAVERLHQTGLLSHG